MTHKRKTMSCEAFSACMAELIAAGEDIFAHPHVRKCKLHRALLKDLETIAQAAKQMFPEIDPPDSVWEGIQTRIEQEQPFVSMMSAPFPGFEVVFAMRVTENGSPPSLRRPLSDDKSTLGLQIFGAAGFPRREGRR